MNPRVSTYNIIPIVLLYFGGAWLSSHLAGNFGIPFTFWIPSGIIVGYMLTKGLKAIWGIAIGSVAWQMVSYLLAGKLTYLSLLFVGGELVTTFLFYRFLVSPNNSAVVLGSTIDIKRFTLLALILPLPQATILITANNLFSGIGTPLIQAIQMYWLGLAAPIFSISPFIIALRQRLAAPAQHKRVFTRDNIFILLLLLLPNTIEITGMPKGSALFPLHFIALSAFIVLTIRKDTFVSSLFFAIFSIVLVAATSLKHGIFASYSPIENSFNVQYFTIFLSIALVLLGAIVLERKRAMESLKTAYEGVEAEIDRQTNLFRDLNDQLLGEIEQKGRMERELTLSRRLLAESQEVARIASWEFYPETMEIRWSETANRILGLEDTTEPLSFAQYTELIHPTDRSKFFSLIELATKVPGSFEHEIRHELTGHTHHFLIKGRSFEENGRVNRIVGLLFDITQRKKAELEIAEKEQKYRALFESNIDAVIVIDGESKKIVDVNRAFEGIYGYSKQEVFGAPCAMLSAENVETSHAIDIALHKGFYRVSSRIHRRKNGEEFYVEGILVKYHSLGKAMLFVILHDITSRKISERNLAEREMKYRLFFESDLIGMAETTIHKNWITFNNRLCQILGYSPQELEKFTWDILTHPADLKLEMRYFNNLLVHRIDSYTIEKRFVRKDGSLVFCNVAVKAIVNPQGNITHLVKLIEDISERKQIEMELIDSQKRLKKAQQIARLGNWSWKLDQKYLVVSNEAYQILGWDSTRNTYTIDDFLAHILPGSRQDIATIIEEVKQGVVNDENIEIPITGFDNEIRYLMLNVGYYMGSNRKVTEIVATMADITEVKRAEIALQEANTMKDQLFSILGHDLRGPVGSIHQMVDVYADNIDTLDRPARDEIINSLKVTAKETYNLLENLLEWAKAQRKATFQPVSIALKPLIDDTIALLNGMSVPKRIAITSSLRENITIFGDPDMIRTIFRNLISNSIKFTPMDGDIFIDAHEEDFSVKIVIRDTGQGFAPGIAEKIFENNFNYSTPGTNNEQGSGLGLKLVKRFVTRNGGRIAVESEVGKGTTFTLHLPKG